MPTTVAMPVFGMSSREATVQEWLKREGDLVAKGEPLLTVETEKAVTEVAAPAAGRLARILVPPGQTVPVQTPLAEIDSLEKVAAPGATAQGATIARLTQGVEARSPLPVGEGQGEGRGGAGRVKATPLARKTARALGVDLARIAGSGPGERVLERDVRAALEAAGATAPASEPAEPLVPLSPVRRVTAERMSLSARSVARVTLFAETDFSEAARFRRQLAEEFERRWQAHLGYDAMLARAAARALARHPDVNSQWADGMLRRVPEINVGVAIQTDRGLLAPVVRRADQLPLPLLARELARLFEAARQGRLTPDELSGGTFTITNLGGFGIDAFTPIVNPPEAAILGVGRIAARPANVDGQIALREDAVLSLSFDHRVLDGVPAAEFLSDLREAIERPYLLLVE
ncbi:MAG: 2-oxo acid dehydrogenase subunit E2 [Chloroflexi bacterium]|nr:2-oxo acid dehydrogenase subunit E2 [Chloroflexota bacterium]